MDRYMDKKELLIASIDDASLIKYYIMPNGVMGLMLIYGNDVMNLAANEKYFPQLEISAVRCYVSSPSSAADSFTREILEKRSSSGIYPWAGRFSDCRVSSLRTGMTEKALVSVFRSFLEHYIGMILHRTGAEPAFPSVITGYRTHYIISFYDGAEKRQLPLIFRSEGNEYRFVIGNLLSVNDSLRISLTFSYGSADVSADFESSRYIGIRDHIDLVSQEQRLYLFDEDEPIYNNTESIAVHPADISELNSILLYNDDIYSEAILPWCRILLRKSTLSAGYAFVLEESSHSPMLICEFSREYLSDSGDIVTDSTNAVHEVFTREHERIKNTHFLPTGTFSAGRYQRYCGKYFTNITEDNHGC